MATDEATTDSRLDRESEENESTKKHSSENTVGTPQPEPSTRPLHVLVSAASTSPPQPMKNDTPLNQCNVIVTRNIDTSPKSVESSSTENENSEKKQEEATCGDPSVATRAGQPATLTKARLTKEYLNETYTKLELQKLCRELGISKIYSVKKEQLIEKILKSTLSAQEAISHSDASTNELTASPPQLQTTPVINSSGSAQGTQAEKDHEITRLNEEIVKINLVLTKMTDRLANLETKFERLATTESGASSSPPPPPTSADSASMCRLDNRMKKLEDAMENFLTVTKVSCTNEKPHASENSPNIESRVLSLERGVTMINSKNNSVKDKNPCLPLEQTENVNTVQPDTLILGDSNLINIWATDLREKCKIRTLRNATFDMMKCWVQENLSWTPSKCIIYGGSYDLRENDSPEVTLDNLQALTSELKQKNNNMKLCISLLVPTVEDDTLQAMINDHNLHIAKWAKDNGVYSVNPDPDFRRLTREIDDTCYEEQENEVTILSRSGVVRLLNVFAKQLPNFTEHVNWDQVKINTERHLACSLLVSAQNSKHKKTVSQNTNTHNQERETGEGWQLVKNRRQRRDEGKGLRSPQGAHQRPSHTPDGRRGYNDAPPHTTHRSPTYPLARTTQPHYNSPHQHHDTPHPRHNTSHTHPHPRHTTNRKVGCFNCGEFNHVQANCRLDHKVKCHKCRNYGHKDRYCPYYYSTY